MKQKADETNRKGRKLSDSQPSDVDKPCSSLHRCRGRLGSLRPEDIAALIVVPVVRLMKGRLFSDCRVPFAEHLSIDLVVFIETRRATREFAEEVFWVVFSARVCHRTLSFNWLPTRRSGT